MPERERKFAVAIPLPGTLAATTERGGYEFRERARITEVQLFLQATGATSGNTDVDVNKAGTSILAAPGLRIANAATTKRVSAKPVGVAGHPAGVFVDVGDYVSVDVDAIPGTASANGCVYLHCVAVDV